MFANSTMIGMLASCKQVISVKAYYRQCNRLSCNEIADTICCKAIGWVGNCETRNAGTRNGTRSGRCKVCLNEVRTL